MSKSHEWQVLLQDNLPQIMLWVGVAVVLLAVGVFIIRRFPKGAANDKPATSDMMDSFRDLHARGQLSDDEYRSIKTKLATRLKQELADPDEKAGSEEQEHG